jgi:hypothetical protein
MFTKFHSSVDYPGISPGSLFIRTPKRDNGNHSATNVEIFFIPPTLFGKIK